MVTGRMMKYHQPGRSGPAGKFTGQLCRKVGTQESPLQLLMGKDRFDNQEVGVCGQHSNPLQVGVTR